jgi:hypothetical protein
MKAFRLLLVTAMSLAMICSTGLAAEPTKMPLKNRAAQPKPIASTQNKVSATRKMLIEKKQVFRDDIERVLQTYEEKLATEAADNALTKIMYEWDLTSKAKLDESERELADIRSEIQQFRRWIDEDSRGLALARAETQQTSDWLGPLRKFQGKAILASYGGSADWSLADAGKIANFFLARFGHTLPVSAMGQSETHDRMGLDHSEAMDVALRPDTKEGQVLMAYLRKAGIPFIAFRSKLRGWATGAHIHIGRLSPKLDQIRQWSAQLHAEEKNPDDG